MVKSAYRIGKVVELELKIAHARRFGGYYSFCL